MSLHLGNSKPLKLYLNNVVYCVHVGTIQQPPTYMGLMSSDNYLLTDSNGVILLPPTTGVSLTLSDHGALKDLSGRIITVKESE